MVAIIFQSLNYHSRPQVRSSNPYIDHIGKCFPGVTFFGSANNCFGKRFYFGFNLQYLGYDIFAINIDLAEVSQNMGAILQHSRALHLAYLIPEAKMWTMPSPLWGKG